MPDKFIIYSNDGDLKYGDINRYQDLAIEISSQFLPFYFFHNKDSIIIVSLINSREIEHIERNFVIIQETNREIFFKNIQKGFINFFEKSVELIKNRLDKTYFPTSIFGESILINDFIEKLYDESLKVDIERKGSHYRLFGKLLLNDVTRNRKIVIKSSSTLSTLIFLISTHKTFPHLLYQFSIVIASNGLDNNSFDFPKDIIFFKSPEHFDYDLDLNILKQSEIEKSINSNVFSIYYSNFKNEKNLSNQSLNNQIMKLFPVSNIGNIQIWSNINKNAELKRIILEIIRIQFRPAIFYAFLFGYKVLNKSERINLLNNINEDPFNGGKFYSYFQGEMKKDSDLNVFFSNKDYSEYYKYGYESNKKMIHWNMIIILIFCIIILTFLILLYFRADIYGSFINQLTNFNVIQKRP